MGGKKRREDPCQLLQFSVQANPFHLKIMENSIRSHMEGIKEKIKAVLGKHFVATIPIISLVRF